MVVCTSKRPFFSATLRRGGLLYMSIFLGCVDTFLISLKLNLDGRMDEERWNRVVVPSTIIHSGQDPSSSFPFPIPENDNSRSEGCPACMDRKWKKSSIQNRGGNALSKRGDNFMQKGLSLLLSHILSDVAVYGVTSNNAKLLSVNIKGERR